MSINNFYNIAQFDFSTLFSVLIHFLISWYIFYSFIAVQLLPETVSLLKFRLKKLKNSLNLDFSCTQYFLNSSLK